MNLDFYSNDVSRMPVYLLLECSSGMVGAPIQAIEQGVQMLHNEFLGQPQAVEMVHLSVITYASRAVQQVPLTLITDFMPPSLSAGGGVTLGDAFHVLAGAIEREIEPSTFTKRGDYKAQVFLINSEEPTDDWKKGLADLRARCHGRLGSIIALGCGDSVNTGVLRQITDNVLLMTDVTSDNLRAFFKWTSQPLPADFPRI